MFSGNYVLVPAIETTEAEKCVEVPFLLQQAATTKPQCGWGKSELKKRKKDQTSLIVKLMPTDSDFLCVPVSIVFLMLYI